MAVTRSQIWLACDFWNAAASPAHWVTMEAGIATWVRYRSILADASPSAAPGARLNETVIASSCPAWLMATGPTLRSTVATLDSGTSAPPLARRKIFEKADSSRRSASVACRITEYESDDVKMVDTCRSPNVE